MSKIILQHQTFRATRELRRQSSDPQGRESELWSFDPPDEQNFERDGVAEVQSKSAPFGENCDEFRMCYSSG